MPQRKNMIYIGSDHGGFQKKEDLKNFFARHKIKVIDLGPHQLVKGDDYPVYAAKVARAVQKNLKLARGILLCRSGQGICIAANRFQGIRAVTAWSKKVAVEERQDNDANILCLPSDFVSNSQAEQIAKAWLFTDFSGMQRHIRRIKEIDKLK